MAFCGINPRFRARSDATHFSEIENTISIGLYIASTIVTRPGLEMSNLLVFAQPGHSLFGQVKNGSK